MKHKEWLRVLIFIFCLGTEGFAQDFIEGIYLFNRAQYDSLTYFFIPSFIEKNTHEEGLARYFLAESYYNIAIVESNEEKITTYLQEARKEFTKAVNSPDLKITFEEFYFFAKYKKGWCSFRLAELNNDPINMLQRAHSEFLDILPNAPDSIKLFSYYMAGESKIKQNVFRYDKLSGNSLNSEELDEIIKSYATVERLYDKIMSFSPSISSPANLEEFQSVVQVKKEVLKYYLGKFYQQLRPENFEIIADTNKKSNSRQTSLSYFRALGYDSLFMNDPALRNQFSSIISYLSLIKYLNQYFISRTNQSRYDFLKEWSKIENTEFEVERHFRLGNLYQSDPDIESNEFNEFSASSYDSTVGIPESYYWLGYLQMIQNDKDRSRDNFIKYLEKNDRKKINDRKRILLEDARYRKYFLDFESFYLSNDINNLEKLAKKVDAFSPGNQIIGKRKERLNLLINCGLTKNTSQIWSDVLIGSHNEKLEQTLNTIQFVLPRAALNIGVIRERYITLLNRLLHVTEFRRSDKTRFFSGIVKSLEAEIAATPKEKIDKFKAAAATLRSIQSNFVYKNEANYIRARCLFFAEEFDQAMAILQPLVTQYRYLRALFYVAEIYRLSENGLAAKKCYEIIISKLQVSFAFHHDDNFWLLNANAGLASAEDTGQLTILDSVDIENVEFQPDLHPNFLAYERLAEEKFVKQQYAREGVDWLMRYGLPQREFYPSKNRLNHSLFADENDFQNIPYIMSEIRGPITSSLKLIVVVPDDVDSNIKVELGNEILEGKEGVYFRSLIPLNSEYELLVQNVDCYGFKQRHKFIKPGEDNKVVVLNKKIRFHGTKNTKNVFEDFDYTFSLRWDANYVLNMIPKQNLDSELIQDFSTKIELRDFSLDKLGNRILAINAVENNIWIYSNDELSKRVGSLQLNLKDSLDSPEGMTVDSKGFIFVADWGNHRVLEFNNSGELIKEIGSFGENTLLDIGRPAKFVFPTRIAVMEDTDGIEINREKFYGEKYLFMADQNGIHICNTNGEYLDTIIYPSGKFARGSFYGFTLEGYGKNLKLFLAIRLGDVKGQVLEFVAN